MLWSQRYYCVSQVNNTARFKPRHSQCRTKSVELDYSPLSSPTHRLSPRRKSSLGIVQKLNMRRRHSMAALPATELPPLPFGTRMKRRSYEDGNLTGSAGELSPGGNFHLVLCHFCNLIVFIFFIEFYIFKVYCVFSIVCSREKYIM